MEHFMEPVSKTATNVLETGVTLPKIRFVIDSCKRKNSSPFNAMGMSQLVLNDIDYSTCMQRSGRTGRICDGFYFPMVTKIILDEILNSSSNLSNAADKNFQVFFPLNLKKIKFFFSK